MKRIMIDVTQEDIEQGSRGSPYYCPLAYAFCRQFPGREVGVFWDFVILDDPKDGRQKIHITRTAQKFIGRFDANIPVKPVRFQFLVPAEVA